MGFDVNDNFVSLNQSHNAYAHTSVCKENPYIRNTPNNLVTIGIFKRTKGKRRRGKAANHGDNCPMIYALKGKNNLRTDTKNAFLLYRSAIKILNEYIAENKKDWDLIIPLPSSSQISLRFAQWIAKKHSIKINNTYLSKKLVEEIDSEIEILKNGKNIKASEVATIRSEIKKHKLKSNSEFPMKIIQTKLRHLINPFSLNEGQELKNDKSLKILLVDDLIATGTSIDCASNLLKELFPNAKFECLSLFSMLDK